MKSIRVGGAIAAGLALVLLGGLYSPTFFASALSQLSIPGYPGPETVTVTATPFPSDKADAGYPGPGEDPIRPTPIPTKDPRPTSKTADAALLRDAKMYSSTYGTDIDESIRRLLLQPEIGELNQQLTGKEAETFGGLYIEHAPDFRVVYLFTHDGQETLARYLNEETGAIVSEIQQAKVTLVELESQREQAAKLLSSLDIPLSSAINIKLNQAEIYVVNSSEAHRQLGKINSVLPSNVVLIEVPKLPENVTAIGGGKSLRTCTSGFSVLGFSNQISAWVMGITTAGHCSDSQNYLGIDLPWQSGTPDTGGVYDIQWHRADQSFAVQNTVWEGLSDRPIWQIRLRANQSVGDFVCKFGRTTGYGCGLISTTSQDGVNIRIDGMTVQGGDSGGPFFVVNTALGTTIDACTLANGQPCTIYAAIDQIQTILGATVLTTTRLSLPELHK